MMNLRHATIDDIPELHRVRMSVKENVLNNPALVTEDHYINYLTTKGKGWLCEDEHQVLGLAIIDLEKNNIWALFVHPDHEKKGIGRKLHDTMLDWYFNQNKQTLWLSTDPKTRAEKFYRASGWTSKGLLPNGEMLFEMNYEDWIK